MCLESRTTTPPPPTPTTPHPHTHTHPPNTHPYPSFSTLGVKDILDKIFKTQLLHIMYIAIPLRLQFIPPFSNVLLRVRATSTVIPGTKQISVHSLRSIFEWVAFSRAKKKKKKPLCSARITVLFGPLASITESLSLAKPPSIMHNPVLNGAPGLVIATRFYKSVPFDFSNN